MTNRPRRPRPPRGETFSTYVVNRLLSDTRRPGFAAEAKRQATLVNEAGARDPRPGPPHGCCTGRAA
ncbi:DUF3018 family protein [Paracoccus sp. S-4012]|nr:DUF3018 family protein [Paracoccus sp. S-4012]